MNEAEKLLREIANFWYTHDVGDTFGALKQWNEYGMKAHEIVEKLDPPALGISVSEHIINKDRMG